MSEQDKPAANPEAEEVHPPMPVEGYTEQSELRIQMVNLNKKMEEGFLRVFDNLAKSPDGAIDKRWLAIGRSQIEQGFMAVNRAIFMPQRIEGPLG